MCDERQTRCSCGGQFVPTTEEMTGDPGEPACDRCGEILKVCLACGQPAQNWAVEQVICEACGPDCVSGSANVDLTEGQQSRLLAWAEAHDLLPR